MILIIFRVIGELGRLHYMLGENQKAIYYLQKVHHLDSSCAYSMDILAYILAQVCKFEHYDHKKRDGVVSLIFKV